MYFGHETVSEKDIKREKDKAKQLRKTSWWLRQADKGICHYCSKDVGRSSLTMDHVVPLSRGGKSKKGNIVPSCKECNSKKKYLLPIEWAEYLQKISKSSVSIS